ncbi:1957_t:CDS:2, partial [Gigaspora margarita]
SISENTAVCLGGIAEKSNIEGDKLNEGKCSVDKRELKIKEVRKRCGKEYNGSVEIDKLEKELAKMLMKDKRLNNEVKIRETEFDAYDIPVVRVEQDSNNRDKASDNEGLVHNYGLVEEVERNEKGMKNNIDDEVTKKRMNNHGDSKKKVDVSKMFKDN